MTSEWCERDFHPRLRPRVEILDAERQPDGVYVTRHTTRVDEKPAWLPFAAAAIGLVLLWRFKLVALLLAAWALTSIDHPIVIPVAIAFLAFVAVYQRREKRQF